MIGGNAVRFDNICAEKRIYAAPILSSFAMAEEKRAFFISRQGTALKITGNMIQ
ncbi:MAG: hypothetical protein PUE61_00935 [Clostridiales bacterium]|nr:hypothetical protein [Clostridiales bacterium]